MGFDKTDSVIEKPVSNIEKFPAPPPPKPQLVKKTYTPFNCHHADSNKMHFYVVLRDGHAEPFRYMFARGFTHDKLFTKITIKSIHGPPVILSGKNLYSVWEKLEQYKIHKVFEFNYDTQELPGEDEPIIESIKIE